MQLLLDGCVPEIVEPAGHLHHVTVGLIIMAILCDL